MAGQRGSLAATQIHENVRQNILTDDIRKEGRTIRRDLLTPITQLRFGPDAPVPFFRRTLEETSSPKELADILDKAVNQLGLKVPASWAHDALGVPSFGEGDVAIRGASD